MACNPVLGCGVGLRAPHISQFINSPPKSVQWVEVISENFMSWSKDEPVASLDRLLAVRARCPVVLHGVSMNLGSVDALDEDYLKKLENLVKLVEPSWISDHLCWTGIEGENLHDLLPLPYTKEALDLVVGRIHFLQDRFKRRFMIENVSSYLTFNCSEMSEWEFLAEIVRRTDCTLLLDVNNVYVSSQNHGFDPWTFISHLPKNNIGQIHLAGHTERDGLLIDTHDEAICESVWWLFKKTLRHMGPVSYMIERDDNIPEWAELEKELLMAQKIASEALLNENAEATSTSL